MAHLYFKNILLSCLTVMLFTPAVGFADEASKGIDQWLAQEKAAQRMTPVKPVLNADKSKSQSMGGPGMDGGGGVSVLGADGRPRLLDMAVGERLPLKQFDRESYIDILTRHSSYASNLGEVVSAGEFFSCAIDKMSRQDNLLLNYFNSKNIEMYVVMTELPLAQSSLRLTEVSFPAPSGSGWAYTVKQKNQTDLSSPSVPVQFQKPIASYGVQEVAEIGLPKQTLMISKQLYAALSESDRCALQIHELLRYISNYGKIIVEYQQSVLLNKPFSTAEIENLTRKIMWERPVSLWEIPASDYYKALAIYKDGLSYRGPEVDKMENALLKAGIIENTASLSEALFIIGHSRLADESVGLGEQMIIETSRQFWYRDNVSREQQRKLIEKKINLRNYMR